MFERIKCWRRVLGLLFVGAMTASAVNSQGLAPPPKIAPTYAAPPHAASSAPVSSLGAAGRATGMQSSGGIIGGSAAGQSTLTAPGASLRQPGKTDGLSPRTPAALGITQPSAAGTVVNLSAFTMTGIGYQTPPVNGSHLAASPFAAQVVNLSAFTMTGVGYASSLAGTSSATFTPKSILLSTFTMTGVGH